MRGSRRIRVKVRRSNASAMLGCTWLTGDHLLRKDEIGFRIDRRPDTGEARLVGHRSGAMARLR
jgi:hypothetical protein